MGFKYNVRMCNQVGIIDADYYNNKENGGHIFVKIKNKNKKYIKPKPQIIKYMKVKNGKVVEVK